MHRVDRLAHTNHWRSRNPLDKAILGLGLLLAALLLPPLPGAPLVLLAALGCAIFGARLPIGDFLGILAWPAGFLLIGGLGIAISLDFSQGPSLTIPPDGLRQAIEVTLRALAAIAAMMTMAATTPLADLSGLARRAGLPSLLVDLILMTYRLVVLSFDCLDRGRAAQAARLGYAGPRRSLRSAGLLAAGLLPRVINRAQRLEIGLAARGLDGTQVPLPFGRPADGRFIAQSLGLIALVIGTTLGGRLLAGWAP